MDVEAYLARINYSGSLEPTAKTLRGLQEAHLLAVPFENLSVHYREPIVLDEGALFEKVVNRRRGGFCYELNGLFSGLLRELGFEVTKITASVARDDGNYTPYFDHLTLMVNLEERWLVEVGFGDTFRQPLRIDDPGEQVQAGASYKVVPGEGSHTLMCRKLWGEWKPQFRFKMESYDFPDFAERCHYQQYAPESHFRQGRICTRITRDGRVTLSEAGLTRTWVDGRKEEQTVKSEKRFSAILSETFDIRL